MLLSGQLTCAELLLHYVIKSHGRVLLPCSRAFTRRGQQLPQVKLTWDSFSPDTSFSSVEDAANAATKHGEKLAAATASDAAAAVEAEAATGSLRHLSLSAEDVKFLRSGRSPLSLLGDDEGGEGEGEAATAKAAGRATLPPGCPHWGRVPEPAALPSQQSTSAAAAAPPSPLNPTYDECARRDWARHFLKPATNPWQELLQLTAEGKLWHYPVDNEQGRELEPEGRLSFQRHVMLERRLQDWVPKTGPVRHFMETVCVGLSKNPHLSVAEKEAHLDWYKGYFADKLEDIQAAYAASVPAPGLAKSA